MTASRTARRLPSRLGLVAVTLLLLAGCSTPEPVLTEEQARAAEVTPAQQGSLGATPAIAQHPGPFSAADLVELSRSPEIVEPESCRDYLTSLTVPGQVVVPSDDAASTDAVVVAAHLDLDQGYVEQAFRVLPDTAAATDLVADLRALATGCAEFEYGEAANVNRFAEVSTGDLPFAGEGFRSTLTVSGTEEVVSTDEVYVMRFGNVVATLRGTAERTEPFAQAVSDNFRAQR